MKIYLIILFLAVLGLPAKANWPNATLEVSKIKGNAEASLEPLLKGYERLYLTASDYRGVTIRYDSTTKLFDCIVPVEYFQVVNWLPLSHDDEDREGWTENPGKFDIAASGRCHDLGDLIGILDTSGIPYKRSCTIRKEHMANRMLATWNRINFKVPMSKRATLVRFLHAFFEDYKDNSVISVYITNADGEQDAAEQPPPAPTPK